MASVAKPAGKAGSNAEQSPKKKRGHRRRPVVYAGMIERENLKVRCVIVDISTKGAKVRTLEPYMGAFRDCVLAVAEVGRIEADVVWRDGKELGLEFRKATALSEEMGTSSVTDILAALNRGL